LEQSAVWSVDSFVNYVDGFTGLCGRTVLRKRKFAEGAESRSESQLAKAGRAVVVAAQSTNIVYRITEEGPDSFEELKGISRD
jgi:hypothetical protein